MYSLAALMMAHMGVRAVSKICNALLSCRSHWQALYLNVLGLGATFAQMAVKSPSLAALVGQDTQLLAAMTSNTAFLAILLSVLYSVRSNVSGTLPNQLPIISEIVDSQMEPF